MEEKRHKKPGQLESTGVATLSSGVAALFQDRAQADVALSDLERAGLSSSDIGIIFPRNRALGKSATRKKTDWLPVVPLPAFTGWTMGMAPWVINGVGPMVTQGALSMRRRDSRPRNLKDLASALGLTGEAIPQMEAAFRRGAVLIVVDERQKTVFAAHILERNGGTVLPRK